MPNDNALEDFNETLQEYETWTANAYTQNIAWNDDVYYIMTVRDDLHELAVTLQSQAIAFDVNRLKNADARWQAWLLAHPQASYKIAATRTSKPKTEWWWWIDQINALTTEQRTTL